MDWLKVDNVMAALAERFGGVDFQSAPLMPLKDAARQQTCIRVAPDRLIEVMHFLHDDQRCRFDRS